MRAPLVARARAGVVHALLASRDAGVLIERGEQDVVVAGASATPSGPVSRSSIHTTTGEWSPSSAMRGCQRPAGVVPPSTRRSPPRFSPEGAKRASWIVAASSSPPRTKASHTTVTVPGAIATSASSSALTPAGASLTSIAGPKLAPASDESAR